MDICVISKDAFYVCGCLVETTSAQNDKDISALYNDFFSSGKEAALSALNGVKEGYYGLSWYTQGHERYCYLLGIEVGPENTAPEKAIIKKIPRATYAKACFSHGEDIIKAWNDFFYHEIPGNGLKVNEQINAYFEYYPGSVNGDFELWVPVVKADV